MRAWVVFAAVFLTAVPATAHAGAGTTLFTPDSLEGFAIGEDLDGTFTGRVAYARLAFETFSWRSGSGFRLRGIGGFSVALDAEPVAYLRGPVFAAPTAESDSVEPKAVGPAGTVSAFVVVGGTAWADRTAEGFDFGRVGLKLRLNGTDETWRAAVVHLAATFPVGAEQARDLHNVTTLLDLTLTDQEWTFGPELAGGIDLTVGRGIGRDPFTRLRARAQLQVVIATLVFEQDLRMADSGPDAGGFSLGIRIPGDILFAELRFRLAGPLGTAFTASLGGRFW